MTIPTNDPAGTTKVLWNLNIVILSKKSWSYMRIYNAESSTVTIDRYWTIIYYNTMCYHWQNSWGVYLYYYTVICMSWIFNIFGTIFPSLYFPLNLDKKSFGTNFCKADIIVQPSAKLYSNMLLWHRIVWLFSPITL